MKIQEQVRYFEELARKRGRIISALVPLLPVKWTEEIRQIGASPFWTRYAFVTLGTCRESLIAFHVRYSTDQASLGNKRDKYSVLTCEEAKRQPSSYAPPEFLAQLRSLR